MRVARKGAVWSWQRQLCWCGVVYAVSRAESTHLYPFIQPFLFPSHAPYPDPYPYPGPKTDYTGFSAPPHLLPLLSFVPRTRRSSRNEDNGEQGRHKRRLLRLGRRRRWDDRHGRGRIKGTQSRGPAREWVGIPVPDPVFGGHARFMCWWWGRRVCWVMVLIEVEVEVLEVFGLGVKRE